LAAVGLAEFRKRLPVVVGLVEILCLVRLLLLLVAVAAVQPFIPRVEE
jgi:hypothetical protein